MKLEPGDAGQAAFAATARASRTRTSRREPGYYAVKLVDYEVDAELTASERVGVHRYRFKPGKLAPTCVLDLRSSIYDYTARSCGRACACAADGTLTGMRETRGWAPGRQLYFAIRFSQPLADAPAA